jgi:hypothetical protein
MDAVEGVGVFVAKLGRDQGAVVVPLAAYFS